MLPILSVSEFIEQINGIIAGEFIIEGEVSQYGVSQNKWIFFSLKDARSVLSCFSTVFMLRAPLEDGMKARVYGYPKIHEKSGKFSFTVQKVEMVGEGALKRAYELLKKKLTEEGLFDESRKRELPYLPQKIGVIASRDSAAFGDFKRILNNRWGGVEIILRQVFVQGEQAVEDITRAFADFEKCEAELRPDVLVLIRGGGSLEDLAAFNSEEVARAIYASRIPVIAGIGHERDVSLAELTADVRASTPSNAAEIVAPDRKDFISELNFEIENIEQTLKHKILSKLKSVEQAFYLISGKLEAPISKGRMLIQSFFNVFSLLKNTVKQKIDFVNFAQRLLVNSNPRQVLRRGYSITRDKGGKIVRKVGQVVAGDEIVVELGEGALIGEVLRKKLAV
ncbi:MAG: exodeoxyribonuclease VII large subunit [Patescibacteria group bacterium]